MRIYGLEKIETIPSLISLWHQMYVYFMWHDANPTYSVSSKLHGNLIKSVMENQNTYVMKGLPNLDNKTQETRPTIFPTMKNHQFNLCCVNTGRYFVSNIIYN